MSIKSNLHRYAVAGAFTLMAATPASANMITAVTGLGNTTFLGAAQVVVPGKTSAPFFNPAGARFVVTFSAECSVHAAAGNNTAYTDVDIVVLRRRRVGRHLGADGRHAGCVLRGRWHGGLQRLRKPLGDGRQPVPRCRRLSRAGACPP